MKFASQFQRNVSVLTQLKVLIDAMKTSKQSCLESKSVSLRWLDTVF